MSEKNVLISLDDVKMHFPIKKSLTLPGRGDFVRAVDGVTLNIYRGETLGLVGESGRGKSTLGKVILQLIRPTSGRVLYNGIDLGGVKKEEMRRLRRELQIVFQDPYSSLNPRLTVGRLISEALIAHGMYKKWDKSLEAHTISVMEKCGLQSHMLHRYPHEFSGGQRQRIGIARALALDPRFVICDESVSTLDVSIQSQILNLLLDLKDNNHLTYLFISHDLGVVRFISDRIGVMYLGEIVELCRSQELFENFLHPYTMALLSSMPTIKGRNKGHAPPLLEGEVPSPISPPAGCKFHPRCSRADQRCSSVRPSLLEHSPGHLVACHNPIKPR